MTKILSTTDYTIFKHFESNRPVVATDRLELSLKESDKQKYRPVIVNKDMKIIDGQHRVAAAQKLGIPVYYTIDPDADENDIIRLNSNQKNWRLPDYLNHFAERKFPEYIYMQKMLNKFEIQPNNYVRFFAKNAGFSNISYEFKNGKFETKFSNERIYEILSQVKEIKDCLPPMKKKTYRGFEAAILKLVATPKYDHKKFMHKLTIYPDYLVEATKYAHMENILQILIDKIYNRGTHKYKFKLQS